MGIYRRLLHQPHVGVLIASTTLTRIPFAINGLAILLFVREASGSFGAAGLVTGGLALGAAFGAPLAARLVDRWGARTLMPLACGHAAALLALVGLGEAGAPVAALAGVALFGGTCFPPSGSVLRARFPELLSDDAELIRGAYALDSVTIEASFVSGPLITAAAVALTGPEAAIVLSAALVVAGTVAFNGALPSRLAARRERPAHHTRLLGALADPGVRLIALGTVPVGFCLGSVEVAIPAFSAEEGSAELAGVLLAVWSLASGVGGFVFGARRTRAGIVDTYLWIALIFPLACVPLAAAGSPLAMAGLVVLAGAPIAPMIASRNELVGVVTPGGTATEAFTWLMAALITGISAGNAVAGALSEAEGWATAVLAGAAVAVLGAVLAFARRGALEPRTAVA